MNTDHRPWPLPGGPWIMAQTWHDLLFAHWPVDPGLLRPLLPPSLPLDTWDGQAYVGVVPFRMSGVRPRGLPALPWLSAFPELNVRTYVTRGGKPGVFFFSLDAGNPVAVAVARRSYHLPYYRARMSLASEGEAIRYASLRTHRGAPAAEFRARYGPVGEVARAPRGTLAHWLTERYCLYAVDGRGRVYRGEIHHEPWPLQPAEATIDVQTMTEPLALRLPAIPPLLHFARRLDVRVWPLRAVGPEEAWTRPRRPCPVGGCRSTSCSSRPLRAHRDLPVPSLIDLVIRSVREFSGSEQEDDQTLVIARAR